MQKQSNLSVAIITFNEADRLPDCIASVSFAEDIVVVDSGSTDDTAAVARELGCRFVHQPFLGFGRQKQCAVDKCRNDWVLILDADERLGKGGADILVQAITAQHPNAAAFSLERKNYLHDRWIRHSGWWPDPLVRLVNRRKGRFSPDTVHERWMADGKVVPLSCSLEHHSFRDYADMIRKLQRYSTLGARQMLSTAKKTTIISPMTHGIWTFIQTYFLKLGLLDGFDGFMIALLNAGGSFMKYAKHLEALRFSATGTKTDPGNPGRNG